MITLPTQVQLSTRTGDDVIRAALREYRGSGSVEETAGSLTGREWDRLARSLQDFGVEQARPLETTVGRLRWFVAALA